MLWSQVVQHSQQGQDVGMAQTVVVALSNLYLDTRLVHSSGAQATQLAGHGTRPTTAPRGPVAMLLDGTEHRLDRTCVPRLLEALPPSLQLTGPVLRALVLGDWTPAPPQCLRRVPAVLQRCQELGLDDVLAAVRAAERCGRTTGCNRHGHTAARQYPGPCGWTQLYAEERVRDRPARQPYVAQMKRYTDFAAWAKGLADAWGEGVALPEGVPSRQQLVGRVEVALAAYEDANRLDKVQPQVEALLGQHTLVVDA